MANITTVPSGWEYADVSAGTIISGGGTIPAAGDGDTLRNYSGSANNDSVNYHFYASRTINGQTFHNIWIAYIHKPSSGAVPSTIDFKGIDSIRGVEVIQVRDYSRNAADWVNVTKIVNIPNAKYILLDKVQNLTGEFVVPQSTIDLNINTTKITSLKMNDNCETLTAAMCTSLQSLDKLPISLNVLTGAFFGDTALTGFIETNCNPNEYAQCFTGTDKPIILYGSGNIIALAKTGTRHNVFAKVLNLFGIII